jgi:hypothetical protein
MSHGRTRSTRGRVACPVPRCPGLISIRLAMCRRHWFHVSLWVRNQLWTKVVAGEHDGTAGSTSVFSYFSSLLEGDRSMLGTPDIPPWRPNGPLIAERARALRLEMQALLQRSLRLCQESRLLCSGRIPPQTVWVRSLRPQRSEPPPLAEVATIWLCEMTRAFQLSFELDVQVRHSAEVISAVEAVREQAPELADWVLPDLLPREPAPREPTRPAPALSHGPLVSEITLRVLDRYNWEPISRSHRTRDDNTDASERQSA